MRRLERWPWKNWEKGRICHAKRHPIKVSGKLKYVFYFYPESLGFDDAIWLLHIFSKKKTIHHHHQLLPRRDWDFANYLPLQQLFASSHVMPVTLVVRRIWWILLFSWRMKYYPPYKRVSMEVIVTIVSKLGCYNLLKGLITYSYIGVITQLLSTSRTSQLRILEMSWGVKNTCCLFWRKIFSTHAHTIHGTIVYLPTNLP